MKRLTNLIIISAIVVAGLNLFLIVFGYNHAGFSISPAKAACDLAEFSRIETEFQSMVQRRKSDSLAVPADVYQAAAVAYIKNAEFCYETTIAPSLQAQTGPVLIDHGGEWFPGSEPPKDELSGQYVTHGNKWGAPGLGNPGGTVTYSYIPTGVSHAAEGQGGNTHISNLNGFSSCFYTEVEAAFAAWAAVTNISFVQVADNGYASNTSGAVGDIRIGAHYMDGPYNGDPTVLAHAYFPPPNGTSIAGDLHFDRDENWRCTPSGGFDIGVVTLHEIGHSLGLEHEPQPANGGNLAIMNPSYNPSLAGLQQDDINGIIAIYGQPLRASISSTPSPILDATDQINFTLLIRNNTNATLTNVQITNIIPNNTTYVDGSANNSGSSGDGKTITWPATTIPGNGTISRSFKVNTGTLHDGDTLVNILSATSAQGASIQDQQLVSFVNPKLVYLPLILW